MPKTQNIALSIDKPKIVLYNKYAKKINIPQLDKCVFFVKNTCSFSHTCLEAGNLFGDS